MLTKREVNCAMAIVLLSLLVILILFGLGFTLHVLWPFLWIWAMAYRPERGWGISHQPAAGDATPAAQARELEDLRRRVVDLEKRQKTGAA